MEYKKYEYDNYTVHFFNTDKLVENSKVVW